MPNTPLLLERIGRCGVVFNVVDAVALMEADAALSDRLNAHTRVAGVLEEALKPGEKRLIVFVLVKCESYLKTEKKRQELIERFEDRHRAVLNAIERMNRGGCRVAGVAIPVNTLGCVEFHEIDGDGNFAFVRTHREFAPRDVDQPLRFALAFALKELDGGPAVAGQGLERAAGSRRGLPAGPGRVRTEASARLPRVRRPRPPEDPRHEPERGRTPTVRGRPVHADARGGLRVGPRGGRRPPPAVPAGDPPGLPGGPGRRTRRHAGPGRRGGPGRPAGGRPAVAAPATTWTPRSETRSSSRWKRRNTERWPGWQPT